MNPTAKAVALLDCIGKIIGVGGSCHCQSSIFVVLFVSSSRTNFKFLRPKKGAQEAFDDKKNSQSGQVSLYVTYYTTQVSLLYIREHFLRGLQTIDSWMSWWEWGSCGCFESQSTGRTFT
jgi:hypothetical protein